MHKYDNMTARHCLIIYDIIFMISDKLKLVQSISVIRPPGYRAKPVIGPVLVWYGSS